MASAFADAETDPAARATTTPAPRSKPRTSLDCWLDEPPAPASSPATQPTTDRGPRNPFSSGSGAAVFRRAYALPGVIEHSDGEQLAGWMFTTREKPWEVWVADEKRWRRIPFVTVLSITAVVVEEKMEQQWRWKEMGVPERVYTGREYPTRRLEWKFHLIDDSTITGTVKGRPLWVQQARKKHGPFVLGERSKGRIGQKLADLVYVKQIVVSRRMMDKVIRAASEKSSKSEIRN